MKRITYWLNWKTKTIIPSRSGLNNIPWSEVEKYPLTILCSHHDWPYIEIEEKDKKMIADEEKRIYRIGLATIKEARGGDEENREGLGSQALKLLHKLVSEFVDNHLSTSKEFFQRSNHWKFAPRFENLQEGVFAEVTKIDIKSCYANIMRDYPLPCDSPELITDPVVIEQKLKEGKEGFVSFYCKRDINIKNNQTPFIPNFQGEIKKNLRGGLFLYTKLFKCLQKKYTIKGKLYYKNFWIFSHKKGCVDKFLNYCEEIKKTDEKRGKGLINALYGILGKNNFSGYHYHPFHLAVNHLAILQTYYLYRQFPPENVLAIRSDCIYVKGELPAKILEQADKYHITKYQQVTFFREENVFIHDTQELKARLVNDKAEREKLIRSLGD